jgi:hypothetical protein
MNYLKFKVSRFFVTVSVYTERVLFSCKSIWMSSGGGPDPLDPPLIYATGGDNNFTDALSGDNNFICRSSAR